jgi:hypothetical protein
MKTLVARLAAALISRETVTFFGHEFEVSDFRLEVMACGNDIDGEIILLDRGGDNHNRITVDILINGDTDEPTRDGGDDA